MKKFPARRILIIKNITREGPGLIAKVFKNKKIIFDQVDLSEPPSLPSLADYEAVIVLGGPDSANDRTPKMQLLLKTVKKIIDSHMPYLGICLGMQVLVKAGGGSVLKNPEKEIGLYGSDGKRFSVILTREGKSDPFIGKLPKEFPIFQLHGETVQLAAGMKLLGTGTFCRHQIVKVGKSAYGFQGHLELTPEMLRSWMREDQDLMRLERKKMMDHFMRFYPEYQKRGMKLVESFIRMIENDKK